MVLVSDQQHLLQRAEIPETHPDSWAHCPVNVAGQMDFKHSEEPLHSHIDNVSQNEKLFGQGKRDDRITPPPHTPL